MARVLLIGTVETKRAELAALAEALEDHGLAVDLVDISLGAAGTVLPGPEKLARMAARGAEAGAGAAAGAGGCLAAIGIGGGTGAEIALDVLRLREIAAEGLESAARGYTVERLPHHINAAQTAAAAVDALHDRMTDD